MSFPVEASEEKVLMKNGLLSLLFFSLLKSKQKEMAVIARNGHECRSCCRSKASACVHCGPSHGVSHPDSESTCLRGPVEMLIQRQKVAARAHVTS